MTEANVDKTQLIWYGAPRQIQEVSIDGDVPVSTARTVKHLGVTMEVKLRIVREPRRSQLILQTAAAAVSSSNNLYTNFPYRLFVRINPLPSDSRLRCFFDCRYMP